MLRGQNSPIPLSGGQGGPGSCGELLGVMSTSPGLMLRWWYMGLPASVPVDLGQMEGFS